MMCEGYRLIYHGLSRRAAPGHAYYLPVNEWSEIIVGQASSARTVLHRNAGRIALASFRVAP